MPGQELTACDALSCAKNKLLMREIQNAVQRLNTWDDRSFSNAAVFIQTFWRHEFVLLETIQYRKLKPLSFAIQYSSSWNDRICHSWKVLISLFFFDTKQLLTWTGGHFVIKIFSSLSCNATTYNIYISNTADVRLQSTSASRLLAAIVSGYSPPPPKSYTGQWNIWCYSIPGMIDIWNTPHLPPA